MAEGAPALGRRPAGSNCPGPWAGWALARGAAESSSRGRSIELDGINGASRLSGMSNGTSEQVTIKGTDYVVVSREPAGANARAASGVSEMIGLRRPNGRKLFAAWTWPDGTIGDVFAVGG